ncbi:MAG: protoheme IX farnesyltransferase [Candidatus Micrarchaeia archaeon]
MYLSKIKFYIENAKLPLTSLLLFTAFTSGLVAYFLYANTAPFTPFLLALLSLSLIIISSNYFTSLSDINVDKLMFRTMNRPLPSKALTKKKVIIIAIIFFILSIVIGIFINIYFIIWILFGFFINNFVYSILLKRKTPLNVIVGSLAGATPVMAAWASLLGINHILIPLMMAGLIIAWTPSHIWSLAIKYSKDYKRAKIPMLPIILSKKHSVRCIIISSAFLPCFTFLFFYFSNIVSIFMLISILLSIIFVVFCIVLFLILLLNGLGESLRYLHFT